jgi:hypothetical protein
MTMQFAVPLVATAACIVGAAAALALIAAAALFAASLAAVRAEDVIGAGPPG